MFYRLAEEKFQNKIDLDLEIRSAIFKAPISAAGQLNADLAYSRQVGTETMRIKQALDNVQSCVMVANKI